jgi:hypothetical protein
VQSVIYASQVKGKVRGVPHMFGLGFHRVKISEENFDSKWDAVYV